MTLQDKYRPEEALKRIFLSLRDGEQLNDTPGTLPPPSYNESEALSLIAEWMNGTLDGYPFVLPQSVRTFGSIYAAGGVTGTTQALVSGTLRGVPLASIGAYAGNIVMDSSQMTPGQMGTYRIHYDLSFAGNPGTYNFYAGWNLMVSEPSHRRVDVTATGTIYSVSGECLYTTLSNNKIINMYSEVDFNDATITVLDGYLSAELI